MSDDGNGTADDTGRLTAAEYVLGVLGAAERRQAEQRIAHDQAFADEIAFWEERLGPMADGIEPVAPPEKAWKRIARAVRVPSGAPKESLWQSLVFWRSFAIGSALAAAASVGVLTFVVISPPRPPLLATIGNSNGQPTFLAAVSPNGTSMLVMPASLLTTDQRAIELWLIPTGDKPHSLGLVDPARPVRVTVPADLAGRFANAVLAISLEPPGGSPTGQPTGPVIANGRLTSL